MKNSFPLATTTWDEAEYEAIQRVIRSGRFTMDKEVAAFEKEFASWHDCSYAVMVNSGSSANLLMIAALFFKEKNKLKQGDEVIVPAISWSTTYAPLAQYGLKVRLVDVCQNTLNFDVDALKKAINVNTRLIFSVNLLGNPNDFAAIQGAIGGRDIILIEDNCESLGAEFNGRKTGTFGIMSSFSSFFSHHISTMEGGVVLTNDEELYHILLCLRAHGWTRQLPEESAIGGKKSKDLFDESYRFLLPGYNLRPLEMSGAIGREQIKKLDDLVKGRRDNASFFQEIFRNHPTLNMQIEVGQSSWFGFSLVVRNGVDYSRNALREELDKLAVEYRPIVAGNFANQEMLKHMDVEISGDLANAEWIQNNGLFIGNHHYDIRHLIDPLMHIGKVTNR